MQRTVYVLRRRCLNYKLQVEMLEIRAHAFFIFTETLEILGITLPVLQFSHFVNPIRKCPSAEGLQRQ